MGKGMFELDVAGRQDFNPWPHSPSVKALALVHSGEVVLDVGCAGGHMARELIKKGCTVHGVEIDPAAAERARQVCASVVVGDLDNLESLPFQSAMFDTILTLDVLEHLRRPDRAVAMLKGLLKPGGRMICSIPNVARIEHRLALLLGRFDYGVGGALSKGHLRFFTRDTARQMLEEAGYRITVVHYTGFASMCPILPNLTAYQFLFVCESA
jgi:2-polyprenyl-3-methyl-5-hydroxy-6-metoxy-1,4-benzoquinol methylase